MRITTRIVAGLFLMAALLIGALWYQLTQVDRLQQVNLELSRTNLEAARISILLVQGFEGVLEFAEKASLLRDDEYRRQWTDWEQAVDAALVRLTELSLEGEEARIRARVQIGWREYRATGPALWLNPTRFGEVQAMLLALRGEVERLIEVNEAAVALRADMSAAAGERARVVARAAAGASLGLAGIASLLLFFSISGPLRHLTRGTRELAAGRFKHRLEIRGPGELADLARDFNDMAARLDELEDLKRDFVSHVSHELKNPLAAVQETVEILLDELPGPLNQKQRHLLDLARRSSGRLSSMIGDLLEVSRLEGGGASYRVASHDAAEIVRSVLEELQPVAEENNRSLDLVGTPTVTVLCDGERVREVVANLVGNAIKFSSAGTRVEADLAGCRSLPPGVPEWYTSVLAGESGPFLLLSVADEGIGVPDEHKTRIFDKFHQVGGRQRIQGQGVGLGLAISRRIVEAHGGAIWVEDRPRGGSIFFVLLPVASSRWRDIQSMDEANRSHEEEMGSAHPAAAPVGRVATKATLALLAVFALPGCALMGGGSSGTSAPAPPEDVREAPPEASGSEPSPAWSVRMDRARALLAGGSFADAASELEAALRLGADGDALTEAHWGLALVYLSPASLLQDRARALTHLDIVEHEASDGLVQAQAAWARETLEQVAQLEGQIQERDELLRQLNDALEMLRRIDLDRRPSGGGAPGVAPGH